MPVSMSTPFRLLFPPTAWHVRLCVCERSMSVFQGCDCHSHTQNGPSLLCHAAGFSFLRCVPWLLLARTTLALLLLWLLFLWWLFSSLYPASENEDWVSSKTYSLTEIYLLGLSTTGLLNRYFYPLKIQNDIWLLLSSVFLREFIGVS